MMMMMMLAIGWSTICSPLSYPPLFWCPSRVAFGILQRHSTSDLTWSLRDGWGWVCITYCPILQVQKTYMIERIKDIICLMTQLGNNVCGLATSRMWYRVLKIEVSVPRVVPNFVMRTRRHDYLNSKLYTIRYAD